MELCKDLMIAAKAGDEEEVKRTIEEGVDADYQNEVGQLLFWSWVINKFRRLAAVVLAWECAF